VQPCDIKHRESGIAAHAANHEEGRASGAFDVARGADHSDHGDRFQR
jgi:hypothetical protein